MRLVYRPIEVWPGDLTPDSERTPSPFSAEWRTTLDELQREVEYLADEDALVVCQLAVRERDLTLADGLRADASPAHPGVVLSFDTRQHGPLRYWTDQFTHVAYRSQRAQHAWRHNLRAIVLGLESLRRVERYGIANRGEQYTGWQQLPSGADTREASTRLLLAEAHSDWAAWPPEHEYQVSVYRRALRNAHPDHGGSTERLQAVRDAARYLGLVEPVALGMGAATG